MPKFLPILFAILTGLHGLIHLMGFVAYWPLAKIPDLPYKTTFFGERLNLSLTGVRLYSLFWLAAALLFVIAVVAFVFGKPIWAPLMLAAVLLSISVCVLDWQVAFRGFWVDFALLLILGIVFGLRWQPAPFLPHSAPSAPQGTIPLPAGLPAPVERYYRLIYGDEIPVIKSAILTGRGTIRIAGITFPARLRFSHLSGHDYRYYIEATFYGFPVFAGKETYIDGHARLDIPGGIVENDPGTDSAANQGLWAEMMLYPASFLADPRVRWESVDADSATLYVPFGAETQKFTLEFDPLSGLLTRMETLRYRDPKLGYLPWWGSLIYAETIPGELPQATITATWSTEGTAWLSARIEDVVYNSDVSAYLLQTGP